MLRFLFTILLVLVAFLGGFYMGNEPVSHLTQSVNGLTIELDAMRERMANPTAEEAAPAEAVAKTADELHVINEGIASVRQELAEHKVLLEKTAATAAVQPNTAETNAELTKARVDLEACVADRLDLEARLSGSVRVPPQPSPPPPPAPDPSYRYQPYEPR